MNYHIYLSYNNNEEVIELPVLPEKIEISGSGSNKTSEVLNLGEVTQLRLPKLFTIQIESEFPSDWYPNVCSSILLTPYEYIAKVEKWRKKLKPIRFVFIGDTLAINSPVSIESFSYAEQGGDIGTWHYKLNLKEYRFYGAQKNGVAQLKSVMTKEDIEQIYIVKEGDTLTSISIQNFGDESAYWEIKRLNGLSDADLITGLKVGMELRLY